MRLTDPQARLLRQAAERAYGAAASGAARKTLAKLEALGLVAFVPVAPPTRPGIAPGHGWKPTEAGLAALAELEQAGR